MKQRRVKDGPWAKVVVNNAGLCQEQNAGHPPTSDGYQPAPKPGNHPTRASLPCGNPRNPAGSVIRGRRSVLTTETRWHREMDLSRNKELLLGGFQP